MGQPLSELGQTDLASIRELAAFFGIGRAAIPALMGRMGVPKRGRGYPWVRVWVALGVNPETVRDPAAIKAPLLDLKEVAEMLGESPKTVRRRSEGAHADKSLPAHVDLGPRKRMFFSCEIHAWVAT
ncbi:helix-turn-helix transcriptional regulator [Leisingera sp. XS_AS12]|uniref:helix-turn-helix transcriptional regulator n=1 Tax=Leisingera sp. XS_AS12 TaxID=3241294 RepID=UPI003514565C